MATRLAEHLAKQGLTARTIATKVRYPDFSIRSRSFSLPVGTADGERIGKIACSLLDRARRDRPGALRLVGVTVSGFDAYEQLTLTQDDEDNPG
jgi:DNA polymerase-4